MGYNPLTNDGHCSDPTARQGMANIEGPEIRRQRNKMRRAITALYEYARRNSFTVEKVIIKAKDGRVVVTEEDRYRR